MTEAKIGNSKDTSGHENDRLKFIDYIARGGVAGRMFKNPERGVYEVTGVFSSGNRVDVYYHHDRYGGEKGSLALTDILEDEEVKPSELDKAIANYEDEKLAECYRGFR
ncbi:hypothetical protein HY450_02230 [Candidatus Pacearchaeota archaeon]|nr:hypothetical protein [Candidatus Pacearchaeota archaeon]